MRSRIVIIIAVIITTITLWSLCGRWSSFSPHGLAPEE